MRKPNVGYVISQGQKQYTGYRPSLNQYQNAKFKNFSGRRGEVEIPLEYDMRDFTESPVRRQGYNDCWAQGATGALERTVSWLDKISVAFSVQDVIDCSGFGTARSGGQIAVSYFEKDGIAEEKNYPYMARDQRCKEGVERVAHVRETGFLRSESGSAPKWEDFQRAVLETGALEVCGSASALRDGGWVEANPRGSTNHCYVLVGWLDGAKHGHKAGSYAIIQNSWGKTWGDNGFGYYLLPDKDGVLRGSVITESKWIDYKDAPPPGPVVFQLADVHGRIKVTVDPGQLRADKVRQVLEKLGFKGE